MPDLCGCDPDRVLDYVYLGPDEDLEHRNSVLFAQESFVRQQKPDFQIRCKSDPNRHIFVRRSDAIRESSALSNVIAPRQGRHAVNAIIVNGPVMGVHLDFISQFLFTGDYAIETRDVEEFPIDRIKHPNGCANCVDHLRLLSLHLSIFHAARYLGMEMLQLLALNRFCSAAEHATSTVLRYIVQDVYTIEPQTLMALPFGKYSLANWFDYRPFLVLPAVMEFIRKHKPAIQPHYASVVRDIQGARIETLRAGWPEADQFEAMRHQIPDFDRHMRWAEIVLAQEEKHPRGLHVSEPTGDLLDTLALPVDQFTQENELQQILEVCEDFDSFCNSHSNL